MKKLMAVFLATMMAFTCVACGGSDTNTEQDTSKVEITDATELLTKVWDEYNATASDDVKFPSAGGNVENMVMDAPAKFDITLDGAEDALITNYCIPAETLPMTDDVATLVHMMNANNFSCAAYHITDSANQQDVVAGIRNGILHNQWMCGFPEKFMIVTVGDEYVVSVFGNGSVIEAFKTAITTVYGDTAVVSVEKSLAE